MKKLISLLLALTMVFSLAICASAVTSNLDGDKVTMTKTYKLIGEGKNVAETFEMENLTASNVEDAAQGVTTDNMPMIVLGDIDFAKDVVTADGVTGTLEITIPGVSANPAVVTLPEEGKRFETYPSVGVYTYTFNEKNAGTAGVTYYNETMTVVVTVVQDASGLLRVAGVHCENPAAPSYGVDGSKKTDRFENTYSAGSISVKKTVTGDFGERDRYFAITVSLTDTTADDYGTVYTNNVIEIVPTSYAANPTSIVVGTPTTFYLKHDETLTLKNIPYGTEYTITEQDLSDYTETITGGDNADGTGNVDSATETLVQVTNDKGGSIDTGITLDSMPFVLILAVCAGAAVLFVIKRRSVEF